MLITYMLMNQDWVFNSIRFPFWELSYGIAWSLNYANLGIKIPFKNKIHQFLFAVRGDEDD